MLKLARIMFAAATVAVAAGAAPIASVHATSSETKTYLVVFKDDSSVSGLFAVANSFTVAAEQGATLIEQAGGTVVGNMLKQTGVAVVHSPNALFDEAMRAQPLVQEAAEDFSWKQYVGAAELDGSAAVGPPDGKCPDPSDATDPDCLQPPSVNPAVVLQWDMQQMCVDPSVEYAYCQSGSRSVQNGRPEVEVGILDSGFDGRHQDLQANAVCARGRNSVNAMVGLPDEETNPGVGVPDPCTDNQFHGTHVAGTVAADDNGIGFTGVAPNVSIIPVKVCDTSGYCYASAVVDGITYAGDMKFEVINMSFFVDDNKFQESHEYKCMSDPVQRTFRRAVERAIQYARNQGVTPVAALGNSDDDLAHPPDPYENECEVVPAETQGVIGVAALGRDSEKAGYSNYGTGKVDIAAPGGNGTTGDCTTTIPSTLPADLYGCIQGTSMASPHAAGLAALIVTQYGKVVAEKTPDHDGDPVTEPRAPFDVVMPPTAVESYMQSSAVDIGLRGYDECFGNGRIHALRAVLHSTSSLYDPAAPFCPEYAE